MIPVVTPAEMRAADEAAPEPVEVLVARAGAAVARRALAVLGGGYGRRVVIVAGKGNNGADGRDAARRLARRGARVDVIDATGAPARLPAADLVIDAAYGTGFRGEYRAPDPGAAPVLAVDIPSGVDGLTGAATDGAVRAAATVTFAALKPGLLLHPGAALSGAVTVADIGLDAGQARAGLVEAGDVAGWVPWRAPDAHKWRSSVFVVGGSPGMAGAAHLAAAAAQRAGAGMVLLGIPGAGGGDAGPVEVVSRSLPAESWDGAVLGDLDRVRALAVGPGLGRTPAAVAAARRLVEAAPRPVVVDADGLFALGDAATAAAVTRSRTAATVLTPHDGEYARLAGRPPSPDRLEATRELAAAVGAVVLLKGSPTVVAEPGGSVLVVDRGDARLATAGTGDVLTGVVAALLAQGLEPLPAAAAAAFLHASAGRLGWASGLVASDLLGLLPAALERTRAPATEETGW